MSEIVFIKHIRSKGFTTLSNASLRDPKLSWSAKGLLANLYSHVSGYQLTLKRLLSQTRNGRDATYSSVNELKRAGYIRTFHERGRSGRFVRTTWEILDEPELLHPFPENPEVVLKNEADHFRETRIPVTPERKAVIQSSLEETTTTISNPKNEIEALKVVVGDELVYPNGLDRNELLNVNALLDQIHAGYRQQLLDELAGAMAKNKIMGSHIAWFRAVCNRATSGQFIPALGHQVSKRRSELIKTNAEKDLKHAEKKERNGRIKLQNTDPIVQRRIRAVINETQRLLHPNRSSEHESETDHAR